MGDILSGLFGGGGGGGDVDIQTITPPTPDIPGLSELNQVGVNRTLATNPYTLTPWRAIDFLAGMQAPQNYVPQYNPQQGLPQYHPPGPPVLNGQPPQQGVAQAQPGAGQPGMPQPQLSPLAMLIGQMFQQLGGMQGLQPQVNQQQPQNPSIQNRQQVAQQTPKPPTQQQPNQGSA